MNLKLKVPGLVLLAAIALSAVSAGPASAKFIHDFNSDAPAGKKTSLTATGENVHTFKATFTDVNEFTCKQFSGKATMTGPQTNTITVTPQYAECDALVNGQELQTTVDMTGCHYRLKDQTTSSGTPGVHATLTIECNIAEEAGSEIDLKVTPLKMECVKVPEQSVHGIYYNNKEATNKTVTVEATIYDIKSETVRACKGEVENLHEGGIYTGNIHVTGKNEAGEPTDIWTTETKVDTG
jgi:hypothetical protein